MQGLDRKIKKIEWMEKNKVVIPKEFVYKTYGGFFAWFVGSIALLSNCIFIIAYTIKNLKHTNYNPIKLARTNRTWQMIMGATVISAFYELYVINELV